MTKVSLCGYLRIFSKSLFLLIFLLASSSAFSFGGGHKKEMFDEPWMKGVDAFGVYFGGNGQADIKFKCDDPNATRDKNGVCQCNSDYQPENGTCYLNACKSFVESGCRTGCTSYHGTATYTICRGTGTCKNGNTCDYSTDIPCTSQCNECYKCDTSVGQCKWDDTQTGLSCANEFGTCVKGSGCVTKQCDTTNEFLGYTDENKTATACYSCTKSEAILTTTEQCTRCSSTRFSGKVDAATNLAYCQLKTSCSPENRTACNESDCATTGGGDWCKKNYYFNGVAQEVQPFCAPKGGCQCQTIQQHQYTEDSNHDCIYNTSCSKPSDCEDSDICQDGKCYHACSIIPSSSRDQCKDYTNASNHTCTPKDLTGTGCTIDGNPGTCDSGTCKKNCSDPDQCKDNEVCGDNNLCTTYTCVTPTGSNYHSSCVTYVAENHGECNPSFLNVDCTTDDNKEGTCDQGYCIAKDTPCNNGQCTGNFWCNQNNKCVALGTVYQKEIDNLGKVAHSDSITDNNNTHNAQSWCAALNNSTSSVSGKTWRLLDYSVNNPLDCDDNNCSASAIAQALATGDDWMTIKWSKPTITGTVADFWVKDATTVLALDTLQIQAAEATTVEDRNYRRSALCILCGDCDTGSYHPGSDTCICRDCQNANETDCGKCTDYVWFNNQCVLRSTLDCVEDRDCEDGQQKCSSQGKCVGACSDSMESGSPCGEWFVQCQYLCTLYKQEDHTCSTTHITSGSCTTANGEPGTCNASSECIANSSICSTQYPGACDNKTDCEDENKGNAYWCDAHYIVGSQENSVSRCVANIDACVCGEYAGRQYKTLISPDASSDLVCAVCSDDYLQLCDENDCPTRCDGEGCVSMYSWVQQEDEPGTCQKCTTDTLNACSEAQCGQLNGYAWDQDRCVPQTTCIGEDGSNIECGDYICDQEHHQCVNPCKDEFSPSTCVLARLAVGGACEYIYSEVYDNKTVYCGSGNQQHICNQGECICDSNQYPLTNEPDNTLYTYDRCLNDDETQRYKVTGCAACAKPKEGSDNECEYRGADDNPSCKIGLKDGYCVGNGRCLKECPSNDPAHRYVSLSTYNTNGKHWAEANGDELVGSHCATSAGEQVIVATCSGILDLNTDDELFKGEHPSTPVYCDDAATDTHIVDVICAENKYFDRENKKCMNACPETKADPQLCDTAEKWTCIENGTSKPTITATQACFEDNEGNQYYCDRTGFCGCQQGSFYSSDDGKCYACDDPSVTIEADKIDCGLCDGARVMRGNYCVPACNSGEFMDSNRQCRSCLDGTTYTTTSSDECTVCNTTNGILRDYSGDQCKRHTCTTNRQFQTPDGYCHDCTDKTRLPVSTSDNCAACTATDRETITVNETLYCAIKSCGSNSPGDNNNQYRDIYGVCHYCIDPQEFETTADECNKCGVQRQGVAIQGTSNVSCQIKVCNESTCNGYCDKELNCHSCDDLYNAYEVAQATDCTTACSNREVTNGYCRPKTCPVGYTHDSSNHDVCKSILNETCTSNSQCPGNYYCYKRLVGNTTGTCQVMTGGTLKTIIPDVGLVYRSPGIHLPYNAITWCDALNDTTPNTPANTGKDWARLGINELRVPPEYRDANGKQIAGTWRIFNAANMGCYDGDGTSADTAVNFSLTPSPVYCWKKNHDKTCENCTAWNAWDQKSPVLKNLQEAFSSDFTGTPRKAYWLNPLSDFSISQSATGFAGYRLNINPQSYDSKYRDISKVSASNTKKDGKTITTGSYLHRTASSTLKNPDQSGITDGNAFALCQFCPVTCPDLNGVKHFHPTGEDCICKRCINANISNETECEDYCGGTWIAQRNYCSFPQQQP